MSPEPINPHYVTAYELERIKKKYLHVTARLEDADMKILAQERQLFSLSMEFNKRGSMVTRSNEEVLELRSALEASQRRCNKLLNV